MTDKEYAQLLVASAHLYYLSSGTAPTIPQIQTVWRSGIIVGVLVPAKTTTDQLKSLIFEFKKARISSSLTRYIPATTPGIKGNPHAQVIIFVFSDPKWASEAEHKKYERASMRTQARKSISRNYLNHIKASYEWDKLNYLEGKEYGSFEPTANSLWCFSVQRLWRGRLMAGVSPKINERHNKK